MNNNGKIYFHIDKDAKGPSIHITGCYAEW